MQIIEKALLIGLKLPGDDSHRVKENLDELAFLCHTAGAEVTGRITQSLPHPDNRTFIGKGKLQEIQDFITKHETDIVVFDDELSPLQFKNLEKQIPCRVIDRTNLILDIFARRAQTAQAKTQVELAQCEYMLPRLTRLWTHLSRQKGGIGMRGPGETELETDKRIIKNKISLLKSRLKKIELQNKVQRKNRSQKVRVSLVGYTNAGKSTIMNMLSKSDVFAEDKLFATLDTTVRNVVMHDITFLLSDTVGFIRKLPHHLVESFKSTLEEAREADILVHVVDISHPDFEQQVKTVEETLQSLKAFDKPILLVYNKIDRLDASFFDLGAEVVLSMTEKMEILYRSFMHKNPETTIFISARDKVNIAEFRTKLLELVKETYIRVYPHYPLTVTG
jgi:GTP-binding protein HflX